MRRSLLPVVVFCFSKKRVDALADNLSHLDLATSADKSEIQVRPMPGYAPLQPMQHRPAGALDEATSWKR